MHTYSVQGLSTNPKIRSSPVQVLDTNKPHQAAKMFLESLESSKTPVRISFNHVEVTNVKGKTIKYFVDVENKQFFKSQPLDIVTPPPPPTRPPLAAAPAAKRMLAFAMKGALAHNDRLEKKKSTEKKKKTSPSS